MEWHQKLIFQFTCLEIYHFDVLRKICVRCFYIEIRCAFQELKRPTINELMTHPSIVKRAVKIDSQSSSASGSSEDSAVSDARREALKKREEAVKKEEDMLKKQMEALILKEKLLAKKEKDLEGIFAFESDFNIWHHFSFIVNLLKGYLL